MKPWIVSSVFWTILIDNCINETLFGRRERFVFHASNIVLVISETMVSQTTLSIYAFVYPLSAIYIYVAYTAFLHFQFAVDRYFQLNAGRILSWKI
jgi:hypothetical protein